MAIILTRDRYEASHTKPISTALHFSKAHQGEERQSWTCVAAEFVFSLIALSGYLIRWQMTKTPTFTDKLALLPSLWHTKCFTQCVLCLSLSHTLIHTLSHCRTLSHKEPQLTNPPVRLSVFFFSLGTFTITGTDLQLLIFEIEGDKNNFIIFTQWPFVLLAVEMSTITGRFYQP